MERKKLMELGGLAPASEMFRLAEQDIIKKRAEFGPDAYQYEIYIRSQVMDGILKTAFYLTRDLKIGAVKPVYEVFIDGKARTFLTRDVIHAKWRSSMLINLEWPRYIDGSNFYITAEEKRGNEKISWGNGRWI